MEESIIDKYRYDGSEVLKLNQVKTCVCVNDDFKKDIRKKTRNNQKIIRKLQDKLYADGKESVIIILQAMDAAGKDGTVKHVMGGVNPQGIDVFSFKQPNKEELAHDFLWRIHKCVPEYGKMGIFNRSYYEDVLVVKVHELNKTYKMAERCLDDKDIFNKRYKDIRHFEKYLYNNSYRVIKVFLNISKNEQKKRLLQRINKSDKNWKFSDSDIKERKLWDDYHNAYEDAINNTSSKHSPWYILPADQKWYSWYLVSEIVKDILIKVDPHYPKVSRENKDNLKKYKEILNGE
ncbi:MAG: PPK2 family polyphosphate kinase [Dysgonamonadaceae bacterium]